MTQQSFKDYYSVLHVTRDASDDEIKKAYHAAIQEVHADKGKEDHERAAALGEAYDHLGAGGRRPENRKVYDERYNAYQEAQRRQREAARNPLQGFVDSLMRDLLPPPGNFGVRQVKEFKIPENDLGLIVALRDAYKATESGKWFVRKSEKDPREWLPKNVYQVERDNAGRVTVFRTIKDWRSSNEREDKVALKKEDLPWETDPEKAYKADARFSEYYLFGEGSKKIAGLYFPPYDFGKYLQALKSMAYKFSRPTTEGRYQLEELSTINRYTENSSKIRMEDKSVSSWNKDEELGRIIPFSSFWAEMRKAEERVHFIAPQGKEGQQHSPSPETRRPSGEMKG